MVFDTDDIPKIFKSEDIIYHYCDLNIALEYILYGKRLRLSHRKNATDPIESMTPFFSYSRTITNPEEEEKRKGRTPEALEIQARTIHMFDHAKQLSFCMNKRNIIGQANHLPEEFFGCLKPRMWDQYANKYRGVCLAFSLEELKKNAEGFICGPVEYQSFDNLRSNHFSIDETKIQELGIENYWNQYAKRIKNIMLRKHLDYSAEDEYKFISFSENEFDYIDVTKALKGVIFSQNYTSDFMNELLNKYCKDNKIELVYLSWQHNGVNFTTQRHREIAIRNIEQFAKKLKLAESEKNDSDNDV